MVTTADPAAHQGLQPKQMRKLMAAGLVGASSEWYDFFIYSTAAALVFGPVFFPDATPIIGTLLAFSTFWAGFIARPLGGVVFGLVGDRIGRKRAVVTCLVIGTAATVLIGCLPTAGQIGVLAPILLVLLRFVQGIAVGGQWGGVILLLTESAMPGRRGRAGAFAQMGVPGGLLLGTAAFLVVAAVVPDDAFTSWGWRIPFWGSALLLPVVLYIHLRVEETPVFQEIKRAAEENAKTTQQVQKAPVRDAIRSEWRTILLIAGALASNTAVFYIGTAGVLAYGTAELGMEYDSLLMVSLVSSLIGIFVIYLAGSASDRIGRKPLLLAGGIVLVVWAFPYFWLVDTGSLWWVFVAVSVGGVATSIMYGPYAAFISELFRPNVRYSGMSIAYQMVSVVVSGGTPFIMTSLIATFGTSAAVSVFILVIGLISLGCIFALRETHHPHERPRGAAPGETG